MELQASKALCTIYLNKLQFFFYLYDGRLQHNLCLRSHNYSWTDGKKPADAYFAGRIRMCKQIITIFCSFLLILDLFLCFFLYDLFLYYFCLLYTVFMYTSKQVTCSRRLCGPLFTIAEQPMTSRFSFLSWIRSIRHSSLLSGKYVSNTYKFKLKPKRKSSK